MADMYFSNMLMRCDRVWRSGTAVALCAWMTAARHMRKRAVASELTMRLRVTPQFPSHPAVPDPLLLGRELRGSWIVFLSHPPSSSPVGWAVDLGAAAPDRGGAAVIIS